MARRLAGLGRMMAMRIGARLTVVITDRTHLDFCQERSGPLQSHGTQSSERHHDHAGYCNQERQDRVHRNVNDPRPRTEPQLRLFTASMIGNAIKLIGIPPVAHADLGRTLCRTTTNAIENKPPSSSAPTTMSVLLGLTRRFGTAASSTTRNENSLLPRASISF